MKRARDDDLPKFDADDAHRRKIVGRLNGWPKAFVAALVDVGISSDPDVIASAIFDAYAEAAVDAAARHPEAPHRAGARAQALAEITALETMRDGLTALRAARAGLNAGQMGCLADRRGHEIEASSHVIDVASLAEDVDTDLAVARKLASRFDGRGDARITRLRLLAERLAPVFAAASGASPTARIPVGRDDAPLIGFALFLAASSELVTGTTPGKALIESVAKTIANK